MSSISSNSFFPPQSFGVRGRSGPAAPPSPEQRQAFAGALKQLGLDDQAATKVQEQVDAAVQKSASAPNRDAVRKAIDDVLTANGIDTKKFHQALRSEFQKLRAAQGEAGEAAQGTNFARGRAGDGDGDADDQGSFSTGALNTLA